MDADWSLSIREMSWVEHTREEVDFVVEALGLAGGERVLDLACGFGRHVLELARRGYDVVGVDITPAFIDDALRRPPPKGSRSRSCRATCARWPLSTPLTWC